MRQGMPHTKYNNIDITSYTSTLSFWRTTTISVVKYVCMEAA